MADPFAGNASPGSASPGSADPGQVAFIAGPGPAATAGGFPGPPPNPLGAKIEINLGGTWTDITKWVMLRDGITISNMGRADETATITSATIGMTLRNDGRFSPKNTASPYYPNIVRNCPIRLSVNTTSATGVAYSAYRFRGEISAWPPGYDVSESDIYVTLTASGIWRRIAQAQVNIGSAYSRWVRLLTGLSVPAAWWSMEDGSGSAGFALSEGTGTNMVPSGTPSYAADGTSFPGSDALPQLNAARLAGNVSSGATPTNNVIRFAVSVPAAGDSTASTFTAGGELVKVLTSGTAAILSVQLTANKLILTGTNSGGTQLFTGTIATKVNGVPVLVSVELTPAGGTVNWAMRIIKPGGTAVLDQVTGSFTGSIAAVTQFQADTQGRFNDTGLGQAGVWYTVPSLLDAADALGGHAGEYAVDRFTRLCAESNIPAVVVGSASAAMGPQTDDTIANLLQSIEDTDGGLLFEPRDTFGLGYRTLASMQNQAAAMTVNYTSGVLGGPLAPTYDDALVTNQWTVTNSDGYSAQAQLTSGALSTQPPPNGMGSGYSKSKNINASTHAQVNAIAQQLLFEGTVDDLRFPVVTFNLARRAAAAFFAAVPSLRIGDYFQVTTLPAFLGGGTAKQLAWGYTERMNHNSWVIDFNTVPEVPFETGFSPGVYSVSQVPAGAVAAGGGTISGAQLGAGSVGGTALSGTISARSLGGITQYISATTPYDWSFAVTPTPADASYFICAEEQALPISVGDTFTHSAGLGGPFTVTSADPPFAGYVNVRFTPNATAVMSSGTVFGGKNGDQWVNTAGGNQIAIWTNGTWQVVQFGPAALSFTAGGVQVTFSATAPASPNTGDLWYDTSNGNRLNQWSGSAWTAYQFGTAAISANSVTAALIAANTITAAQIAAGTITAAQIAAHTITAAQIAAGTITASQIAAGVVIAGIVDGTTIQGATIVADGTSGEILVYSGSPALGNLIGSWSGASGTDGSGNAYAGALEVHQGGLVLDNQASAPAGVSGASTFYSSVAGRPRYLSQVGNDSVLTRETVNVSQFTAGNVTTATIIGAPLSYLPNEANQSSEFEIEIDGIATTASTGTAQTLTFQLGIDGTPPTGAGPVTFGAVFMVTGATFAFVLRFRLNVVTTGAGGTANIAVDGAVSKRSVNAGSTTSPVPTVAISEVGFGKAFDTTAAHTLQPYAFWGGNTAGQTLTTYRTRVTRRM